MELIDKAAVVAEIKRRLSLLESGTGHPEVVKRIDGVIKGYKNILSFLDTLEMKEMKEVDLEKELIEWHKEHFKKDGTFIGMSGSYLTNNSQMDIACHFFELGLKAQKGGDQ